jgi:hypothetical protein
MKNEELRIRNEKVVSGEMKFAFRLRSSLFYIPFDLPAGRQASLRAAFPVTGNFLPFRGRGFFFLVQ